MQLSFLIPIYRDQRQAAVESLTVGVILQFE